MEVLYKSKNKSVSLTLTPRVPEIHRMCGILCCTHMKSFSRHILRPGSLGFVLMTSGCVSLHSFRDVTIRLTVADSGKPVASSPFRLTTSSQLITASPFSSVLACTSRGVRSSRWEEDGRVGRVIVALHTSSKSR
jgi:hypothetical protein